MACADFKKEIKGMFKNPFEEQNVMQKAFKAKAREHEEVQSLKKDKTVDGSE